MAKQVQFRGGTASEHATFTGANREITVDTTNKTLRVHDGSTAGGQQLAKAGANTDITSVVLNQTGLVVKGGSSNALTVKPNETLSAARTLNVIVNDDDRTVDLSGDLTISGDATVSGTNTGDQSAFTTIAVSGQDDVVADSETDTLTLAAGSNITITTDAATDTVTIAAAGGSGVSEPSGDGAGGRLSFATATPVMTETVTGATSHYFCPYKGSYIPLFDGTDWTLTDTGGELSQTASDSTKSPAAAEACCLYNIYGWDDNGTIRATRGPALARTSATVTMTIASPCVVSWTGHGFNPGDPVIFTTTGALPTGVTAGTVYWVISSNIGANTFRFSASRPGTGGEGSAVNTSGSQSGTHTATKGWTGTPTSELTAQDGMYVNTNTITNGPAASRGTYLGTIATNETATYTFKFGSVEQRGGYGFLSLWNFFNRTPITTFVGDNTNSWSFAGNTTRPLHNSYNNHIRMVTGIQEDTIEAKVLCGCVTTNAIFYVGIGVNSYNTINYSLNSPVGPVDAAIHAMCFYVSRLNSGMTNLFAIEKTTTTSPTGTIYGDNGGLSQSGIMYSGRF